MRYYIAYKFLDSNKEILRRNLEIISSIVEREGNSAFIFCRDVENRQTPDKSNYQIISESFTEIKKSDGILAFVESEEKSEGMLLEIGYAKALWKKLTLLIKKWINLRFVRVLADKIIEFDTIEDVELNKIYS